MLAILAFPAFAAAIGFAPVVALGPIAFAIRRDFALDVATLGVIYTAFFVASAVLAGVGGYLAARFDPARVVRLGLVGSSLVSLAIAFASSSAYLVVASVVAGAVNGLATSSMNVMITSRVRERRRGLAFGAKVAAVPATSTLAGLAAYAVATLGMPWQVLYAVCAAVGFVVVVVARRAMGVPPSREQTPRARTRRPPASLVGLGIAGLLGATSTALIPAFLVDGLIARGQAPDDAAVLLVVVGWFGIVARVAVGGGSDRYPQPILHLRVAAVLLVVAGVGMLGLGYGSSTVVLVIAAFLACCIGWAWPGLVHHAAMVTHPENEATATGFMQTGTFAGSVIGPLSFGFVASRTSFTIAWSVSATCAVLAAALLVFATARIRAVRQVARDPAPEATGAGS
jgi:MFS family permease